MKPARTGLILEGGGLRGVYTSGVLRYFMEKRLYFPYVVGVSMGACNAANYVSRQPERNRIVNTRFVNDRRYLSYRRLFTRGELFGMDFIFKTIPNVLVPFDFETFKNSPQRCITVATDCHSGEALYYEKEALGDDYLKVLQASCSLPFLSKPVRYKGRVLLDGGLSDSIPIRKSMTDGNEKHVLILTRPKGYRKSSSPLLPFLCLRYRRYKGLCNAILSRNAAYNEIMAFIDDQERRGRIFVIRPGNALNVGRAERDKSRLCLAYDRGYEDAARRFADLGAYLDCKPGEG